MFLFLHINYSKNRTDPEHVVLLKRIKEDIKNVDHVMINYDIATVRECSVHDSK